MICDYCGASEGGIHVPDCPGEATVTVTPQQGHKIYRTVDGKTQVLFGQIAEHVLHDMQLLKDVGIMVDVDNLGGSSFAINTPKCSIIYTY